jgi:serine phosphatase RsbU (regulator of sigma subunit)
MKFADGRLGIVVGDVSGKGMPAALVMAATRSLLYCTARSGRRTPGEVLQRVNDLLHPNLPPGAFVTCLYAILDPATGGLRYANAGHNVPYRRSSGGATELWAAGMPLGLMPGMSYAEQETTLAVGDGLLLHSDGLVEARNPQQELFGFPRLETFLTEHGLRGPALVEGLLGELQRFIGRQEELDDDLTLVMLERLPAPETNSAARLPMAGENPHGNAWAVAAPVQMAIDPGCKI